MKVLDDNLEVLHDSDWHFFDELRIKFYFLPEKTEREVIRFLKEEGFIDLDKEKNKVKITPLGLRLLELPRE